MPNLQSIDEIFQNILSEESSEKVCKNPQLQDELLFKSISEDNKLKSDDKKIIQTSNALTLKPPFVDFFNKVFTSFSIDEWFSNINTETTTNDPLFYQFLYGTLPNYNFGDKTINDPQQPSFENLNGQISLFFIAFNKLREFLGWKRNFEKENVTKENQVGNMIKRNDSIFPLPSNSSLPNTGSFSMLLSK